MTPARYQTALLSATCLIMLVACQPRRLEPRPRRGGAEALQVDRVQVNRVRLAVPTKALDVSGAVKEYTTAFLVRLQVERPRSMGPVVRFYVGDYEVPEYGGWKKGIYFKVYDPAQLKKLTGQELQYSYRTAERRSLKARLEVPDLEKLKLQDEREVLLRSD